MADNVNEIIEIRSCKGCGTGYEQWLERSKTPYCHTCARVEVAEGFTRAQLYEMLARGGK